MDTAIHLVFSYAVGVGNLVPKALSRLILHLKIHALRLCHSGVSSETIAHREEGHLLEDDIDQSLAFVRGEELLSPVADELEPLG